MLPNFDELPTQFPPPTAGRVLLLDSDFMCYQAAATVKTLPTAVRRFQTLVETQRFLVNAESVRVHITPRGCTKFRREWYPSVKVYQDNRSGKPKPPLLHPLRQEVLTQDWDSHWSVHASNIQEADDSLMMDALVYGDNAVMVSGDKDLNITPGPLWLDYEGRVDIIPDRFGWIKTKQLTSQTKVVGHGTKFFWAQMLMGDTADNVAGLTRLHGRLCGAVGAFKVLNGITSEADAAEFVLRAYIANKQNPLAEAECLWLRRSLQDSGYRYLCELGLPDFIQQWLDQLNQYHEEVLSFKAQEREEEKYDEDEQACTTSSPRTEVHGSSSGHYGCAVPWEGACDAGCRGCNAPS